MAEKEDRERKETLSFLKKMGDKLDTATKDSRERVSKLGENVTDAFKATFANSPIVGSMVDIAAAGAKDAAKLGKAIFIGKSKDTEIAKENAIVGEERLEIEKELLKITEEIKQQNESGETTEDRRENTRKVNAALTLQERQNELLEKLGSKKKKEETGFFGWLKKHLVLTFYGLFKFLQSPIKGIKNMLKGVGTAAKSLSSGVKVAASGGKVAGSAGMAAKIGGGIGKVASFAKVLGPIGLAIGLAAGAFSGFHKTTEIFGKDASTLEKISATIGGALSGITFGLIDTETFAKGIKAYIGFYVEISKAIFGFFKKHFKPAFDSIGVFITDFVEMFSDIIGFAKSLFGGSSEDISKAWEKLTGSFTKMFASLGTMIETVIMSIVTLPLEIVKALWSGLQSIGTWISERASIIGPMIMDGIRTAFDWIINKFGDMKKWLIGRINAIGGSLGFENLTDKIKEGITGMIDSLLEVIYNLPFGAGKAALSAMGVDVSKIENRIEKKKEDSGEGIYEMLKQQNLLSDNIMAFGNSDTLSNDVISNLSTKEASKLSSYLIESGNAKKDSQIMMDLQAQLEKLKVRDNTSGDSNGNTMINAPVSNVTNNNQAPARLTASPADKTIPVI